MKALTFEEWEKLAAETTVGQGKYWRVIFDAARQGMTPEDESVRIPPVSEWPQGAVGYYSYFAEYEPDYRNMKTGERFIPRPVPAWCPKVGDAVFWTDTDSIRKVVEIGIEKFKLSTGPWATIEELKTASSIDQIGKPWEEI